MQAPLLIQVILTLVVQISGALHKRCPSSEWVHCGNKCYIIPDAQRRSWYKGRQLCQRLGGDLVLPRSQEENAFVYQMMLQTYDGNYLNRIWIGCFFKDSQWDCAKDPDEYTNWSTSHEKQGNCPVMLSYDNGKWRGVFCTSDLRRVMCQKSQEPVSRALTCSAIPRDQPRCLADHALTEFRVRTRARCSVACLRDPACRSFNLKGDLCQLNNVTASQVHGAYISVVQDCVYYECK